MSASSPTAASDNGAAANKKRARPSSISTAAPTRRRSDDSSDSTSSSNKRLKSSPSNSSHGQNIRVVARLRPLSSKEKSESSKEAIKVVPTLDTTSTIVNVNLKMANGSSRSTSGNKSFHYDGAFGPSTSQQQLYEHTVGDLVRTNIFKGFNVTVMAYGQTGAGKTFTMGTEGGSEAATVKSPKNDTSTEVGKAESKVNESVDASASSTISFEPPVDSDGIIPRAVFDLFDTRRSMPHGEDRVTIEMSYMEIYNEEARDLLASGDSQRTLQIRDSRTEGVVVQNLSTRIVSCPHDVATLMATAATRRATASTAMNAVSSRSHAICTLHVTIAPLATTTTDESSADPNNSMEDVDDAGAEMKAKLTLVDLAGSERVKRTGAEGKRLKEGININKGLFVLGQVVSALSELGQQGASASQSNAHIPYRDSKLTRLLQDSLGGNSRTVMVACISPADSNVEESINTLRYAQRTRNITNSAIRNVVANNAITAAEAAALKRENQVLKLQLAQAQAQLVSATGSAMTQPTAATMNIPSTAVEKKLTVVTSQDDASSTNNNTMSGIDVGRLDVVKQLRSTISSLESKLESLEEQQQSTADDVLAASIRADKWQVRYEALVAAAKEKGVMLSVEDTIPGSENDDNNNMTMDLATELRQEISNLKTELHDALADAAIARATAAAIVAGNGDLSAAETMALSTHSPAMSMDDKAFARFFNPTDGASNETDTEDDKEEKLKLTAELVAVSGGIEAKEAMVVQMNKERECMEAMRCHFENAVQSLQEEVDVLSAERTELLAKVVGESSDASKAKQSNNSEDLSRMKARVIELEGRIKDLRQKAAEHTKSLRLREAAEQRCAKLAAEIQADKKRRVSLQKQLKEQATERRSEKKAAQKEAAKLLRNSNRLKYELQKVKDAAAKQAAVLRRKTTEALNRQKREADLQAKRQLRQEQRKHMAAMKTKAKKSNTTASSSNNDSAVSNERVLELVSWLDHEIESASALKENRDQIKEQKQLLTGAISKRNALKERHSLTRSSGNITVDPSCSPPALQALEEEIEMRTCLIEELESNVKELYKLSPASPTARASTTSSCFMDMTCYLALPQSEATVVFLNAIDHVLKLKKVINNLESKREDMTATAVSAALAKERRAHEDAIIQLKMDHSQAMMNLLNSTKGSIEHSVRLNSLNSLVDDDVQSSVEQMLESYLKESSKIGEAVQVDLRDVKQAQEGMKQMVENVATDMIAAQISSPVVQKEGKKKKKKSKKRMSNDSSIMEDLDFLEVDDAEEDNSDDSDWSPSNQTPGPRRRGRKWADSVNNDNKRRSKSNADADIASSGPEAAMGSVAEEKHTSIEEPDPIKVSFEEAAGDSTYQMVADTNQEAHSSTTQSDNAEREPGDEGKRKSATIAAAPATNYGNLKVKELREILRSRNLVVSGVKSELINRLQDHDCQRAGLADLTDVDDEIKENMEPANQGRRRTSTRASRNHGGLQTRDLNKPVPDSRKGKAKVALLDTPPQSTQKVGGWSTKKIASVRRSTIFSHKKRALSPSSPESNGSSDDENCDENMDPSNGNKRRKSLRTLNTRRNLGVQL